MIMRLSSGFELSVSPIFFWEDRREELLKIRTRGAFHPLHPTTRLCLELLAGNIGVEEGGSPPQNVLDAGCGSGILALAAVKMGARRAVGFDIDPRSVQVSRENAERNGLDAATCWFRGSTGALKGRFDRVLANLPRAVILELLDDLVRLTAPEGRIVLSGFHDIDRRAVEERLNAHGMEVLNSLSADLSFCAEPPTGSFTWIALEARRRAIPAAGSNPVLPPGRNGRAR